MRVGLPRMHREAGEKRDFLPRLVVELDRAGAADIVIERGYGSGMDLTEDEYRAASGKVTFGSLEDCLGQDAVLQLRCPHEGLFEQLRPGSLLMAMLHFPTRPKRVRRLGELGMSAVGIDGLHDDRGKRLVENLASVGWSGVAAAFVELAKTHEGFSDPGRSPIRVTLLGSGAVGAHAVHAASRYGDIDVWGRMSAAGALGVEVRVIDYDLTWNEKYMRSLLATTDILIDATQRPDPTLHVIPNAWVAELPGHAVLLDLSADPYDFSVDPPIVKGIEGMPQGSLDQFVFYPDDPAYEKLDHRVSATQRRVALSCYSWPGRSPRSSMEVYGAQLEPFLEVVINKPVDTWRADSDSLYERALARAEIARWLTTDRMTASP
ncbi:MAG: hypothetical protein ACRDJB_04205 [Actinomycetota bacterium]